MFLGPIYKYIALKGISLSIYEYKYQCIVVLICYSGKDSINICLRLFWENTKTLSVFRSSNFRSISHHLSVPTNFLNKVTPLDHTLKSSLHVADQIFTRLLPLIWCYLGDGGCRKLWLVEAPSVHTSFSLQLADIQRAVQVQQMPLRLHIPEVTQEVISEVSLSQSRSTKKELVTSCSGQVYFLKDLEE